MGHPTMQENDTAKLTPTSFYILILYECYNPVPFFLFVL